MRTFRSSEPNQIALPSQKLDYILLNNANSEEKNPCNDLNIRSNLLIIVTLLKL